MLFIGCYYYRKKRAKQTYMEDVNCIANEVNEAGGMTPVPDCVAEHDGCMDVDAIHVDEPNMPHIKSYITEELFDMNGVSLATLE